MSAASSIRLWGDFYPCNNNGNVPQSFWSNITIKSFFRQQEVQVLLNLLPLEKITLHHGPKEKETIKAMAKKSSVISQPKCSIGDFFLPGLFVKKTPTNSNIEKWRRRIPGKWKLGRKKDLSCFGRPKLANFSSFLPILSVDSASEQAAFTNGFCEG